VRTRWLIAIVAACSSKQLLIEVDTGSDVDTVELMIVDGDCTAGSADCAGIGPPGVMSKPNGNVYYLDGDDRLAAKPVNGHARFALEPGKTDFMPRLLAVGFDTNDRANGLTFVPNVDVDLHLGEWQQPDRRRRERRHHAVAPAARFRRSTGKPEARDVRDDPARRHERDGLRRSAR
jgi:hypothetical protein